MSANKSKSILRREAAQRGESIEELVTGALDETRELVRSLPEELFVLRKLNRAADQLADACRNSGDERIMAKLEAYLKASQAEENRA